MELALVFALAIFVGIIVGLLPGLPVWFGPLLLLPFLDQLTVIEIFVFWTGCSVGSQFFSSVAALLLKIPGEAGSLIYLDDIDNLTWGERLETIRQSAIGSFFASAVALSILTALTLIDPTQIMRLGTFEVKFFIYVAMLFFLTWYSNHKAWTLFLFLLGVLLVEKTNQSLPVWLISTQRDWDDITSFTMILGLIVIPEWLYSRAKFQHFSLDIAEIIKRSIEWRAIIPSSLQGAIIGLIPGPSATISSMISYNTTKGSVSRRIISAETSNNSAIITSMFPFLLFGIPIGMDQAATASLFEIKSVSVPTVLFEPFGSMILLHWIIASMAACSTIYFFLSQSFLGFYTRLIQLSHTRLWWIYLAVICAIVWMDVKYSVVSLPGYLGWLAVISIVGALLHRSKISALPLVLGFILGDQVAWAFYHFFLSL
jgi:putative tricarboxylic transport membrane protein